MSTERPFVIAHRGGAGLVEMENSVEAFEAAIALGVPMLEFDVRETADRQWVCFHDAELDGVPLREVPYSALKALGVPTVEEAVKLCAGRIRLDIELKEAGYERALVWMVRQHMGYEEFVVKSFLDGVVGAVKRWDPKVTAGLLLGVDGPRYALRTRLGEVFPERRLRACRADFVSPNWQLLKAGFKARMRRGGWPVWVWTVNTPEQMHHALDRGADALITDYPDKAAALIEARGA